MVGEKRWQSVRLANLEKTDFIIKGVIKKENIEVSIIENIQQEDLSLLEEANIYKKLIDECDYTQKKLAEKLKKLLLEDKLSVSHTRLLSNSNIRNELVKFIQENKLSVQETENVLNNKKTKKLKNIDFYKKLKDPEIKKFRV